MNDLNERLMKSLNRTYRTLHTEAQGTAHDETSLRGARMDRKETLRKKEQALAFQRDQIIRELAAIARHYAEEGKDTAIRESKLAKYLNTRPESISDSIGKLEREGFLRRSRSAKDRREMLLKLTEKGWGRAAELQEIKDRKNAEFLKPLTDEERATLLELLGKLNMTEELGLA